MQHLPCPLHLRFCAILHGWTLFALSQFHYTHTHTSSRPRRHGSIALKASDTCQRGRGYTGLHNPNSSSSRRVTTMPLKKETASEQSPNNGWKIAKAHRMHLNHIYGSYHVAFQWPLLSFARLSLEKVDLFRGLVPWHCTIWSKNKSQILYVYIYICVCVCVCLYYLSICIYIYITVLHANE